MYDGRGSVSGLTAGQKAQQVVSYSYNEWGAVTSGNTSHGSTGNGGGYYSTPFQYNGEALDISVSLQYLRARYYDPGTKRFIQQDTVWGKINVPLSQNLYAYVQNSPLNFVDPSGHYLEEKQTYLNRIAEANDQISSLQAMMNNGASLTTRSVIQDEISRLNGVLDESRRTLAVIEGQMSYQQAFPKYAQLQILASTISVRQGCDTNPALTNLDLWDYAKEQLWNQTGKFIQILWNNTEFKLGAGFGAGQKLKILSGAELSFILWGGEITYNPVDGFNDTTKFLDFSVNYGLSKNGFMVVDGGLGYHAPTDEIRDYGAIYAPHGAWDASINASIIGDLGVGASTDSQNNTGDIIISYGQGGYILVGGEYEVSLNITGIVEDVWDEFIK